MDDLGCDYMRLLRKFYKINLEKSGFGNFYKGCYGY